MLANPSVLFLDEPTTGLDATSAFQLVRTLKNLADRGRTIILTIHQPRSEIWNLFDNLIIMSKGSPVFSGLRKMCMPYFESLGYRLPRFVNPAEFVIDVSAVDTRTPDLEQETTIRVQRLKMKWAKVAESIYKLKEEGSSIVTLPARPSRRDRAAATKHANFFQQTRIFTDRTLKVTYRDPMGMAAAILEAVVMGLVTGYIFYNIPRTESGIRSREGAMYTVAALQGYLWLLFEVFRLTVDMPTFDREHNEGCADVLPFLISRRLARLVTEDLAVPFLFGGIFYLMAGFDRTLPKVLTFFAIVVVNHFIGVTCAMACVAASRDFAGASLIANMAYTLQGVSAGFYIQANTIPIWVRWMKYTAYIVSRTAFLKLPSMSTF
jgi:energy-coupling factor transporter ATP-binding protein EcfA2